MDRPDQMIGRYRLIRQLGAGGMGTVWLAARADGAFDQNVALKLLHGELEGGEPVARFLREREILGGLDSPSIARILDAGVTEDGRPYLAMEAIDGLPIDRHCDGAGLGRDDRLGLLEEAAAAVGHAHGRHVIHRDIKPANVLVTAQGQVKLIDFGIAAWSDRPLGQDAFVTQGPLRFLTKEYAAPEQLAGAKIAASADVYALGALGHELLFGSLPTDGNLDPRCSGDLKLVFEGALQKVPEERYASATLLAEDLGNVRTGVQVRIRGTGPLGRSKRWLRRHWDVAATLLSAAAILVVFVVAASSELRAARASLAEASALRASTTTMANGLRELATEHLTTVLRGAPPGREREHMITSMAIFAKEQQDAVLAIACATASLDLAEQWAAQDSALDPTDRGNVERMMGRATELLGTPALARDEFAIARRALLERLDELRIRGLAPHPSE